MSISMEPRTARAWLPCLAICLAMLITPFGWRIALWQGRALMATLPASYLPALEPARERRAFEAEPIDDLHAMAPAYVIIGDSMAGRIDPDRLSQLTQSPVAPILQNATGSAYWYLVFKNYVVRSGITPKWVIVFFRDTNMTDPMFRIGGSSFRHLDEVALDHEDELNTVVAPHVLGAWFRAHRLIDETYAVTRAREWLEPQISARAAAFVVPDNRQRAAFLNRLNAMFALDRLRLMTAADVDLDEADADFGANINTSVLPLFLQLAKAHDLHLCFVRVLRRPQDGQLPPQSARMTQYVRDLRTYLEAHDAVFRDDRDDPEMARLAYADGDHIHRDERIRYTDEFVAKTPIFK